MKILIVAGGTGGHIFPALALAEKIIQLNPENRVLFCIDKRVNTDNITARGFDYYVYSSPKMPYKAGLAWLKFLIGAISAFFYSFRILNRARPQILVGFGAYLSGPILFAGRILNKKIVIHEQNVVMGRANTILSNIADKVALGFENKKYTNKKKFIVTGNPLRKQVLDDFKNISTADARKKFNLDSSKKTLLVFGGSQGSGIINSIFTETVKTANENILSNMQIIHLTGDKEFDNVCLIYSNTKIDKCILPFFDRMGIAYKASDAVISRAGALTVTELDFFKKPALLIPYEEAAGHQYDNALYLQNKSQARIIKQKDLTPCLLEKEILDFISNRDVIDNPEIDFSIDAAGLLAKTVLEG